MTAENTIMTACQAIAQTVRSRRSASGMSQNDLAARAGVSKGALVKIESGRGNPGIGLLCAIASALGVSLGELLGVPATPASPEPFAMKSGKEMWRGPKGGSARLLCGTTGGPEMVELWQWRMLPRERYHSRGHSAGTHEILVVQRGTLRLTVREWEGIVKTGQGIMLRTDSPHSYACEGSQETHFRMFVSERPLNQASTAAK